MVFINSFVLFSFQFVLWTFWIRVDCFSRPKIEKLSLSVAADPGPILYLTPLIQSGQIEKAKKLSKVKLGGITSYSGLLTVNETCGSNIFFWVFPSKSNWTSSSTLLWLQGGPGVTSMLGLFELNGPFKVTRKGLKERKYSWNENLNLLYIDNPVGTGYSFTKSDNCYPTDETAVGKDLYVALVQFFTLFPRLQTNPFYASGESYAGKYVPAISYAIHKHNPTAKLKINLKGLLIGNGLSDPLTQQNYSDYLYNLGLIDDEQRKKFVIWYNNFKKAVENKKWSEAEIIISDDTLFKNNVGLSQYYDFLHTTTGETKYWTRFIQTEKTRRAIHVGSLDFLDGENSLKYLLLDTVQSVKPWIEELLEHYDILFYNGELDIACGYPMMINMIRSFNWSDTKKYKLASRVQWYIGTELVGYYKKAGHLTEVLVRGAGHMVPIRKPKAAFQIVCNFTLQNPTFE